MSIKIFKKNKQTFSEENSMPMRREKRRTWQNILMFFALIAVLFVISFALAWNLIGAQTKPNNEAIKQLEIVQQDLATANEEKNELLNEIYALREQLYNSNIVPTVPPTVVTPSIAPSPSAEPPAEIEPSPSVAASIKPSPTLTPSPSVKPSPSPSPNPSPSPKSSPVNITQQ